MTCTPVRSVTVRVFRFNKLLIVLFAVLMGILRPEFGVHLKPFSIPLVVILVFTSLYESRSTRVYTASYGWLLVLSLVISYLILPIGGIRVASLFLSDSSLIGVAIILAVPTTAGSAVVWTRLSGGDAQLSTVISVVSILVAPVVTPAVFSMLVRSDVDIPVVPILRNLVIIVVGGIALTLLIPSESVSRKTIDRTTGVAILLLIYSSVANLELISISPGALVALVIVTVVLLCGGLLLSVCIGYCLRLDQATVLPLFFTSVYKNLGIALFISFFYTSPMVVAAIVVYYITQQIVGAIITDLPSESLVRILLIRDGS